MQRWFRARTLRVKFLLVTVPAILLSALLFFAALVRFELSELKRLNEVTAVQQGQRDAYLLSYPVWNLEDDTILSILDSLAKKPGVRCIRLKDVVGYSHEIVAGKCSEDGDVLRVLTQIQFAGRPDHPVIGELEHVIDVSVNSSELFNVVGPLLELLLILVTVLILCVFVAFRWTILAPLDRIGASLRAYRASGVRQPVDWDTGDELGEFIREYNQGLVRQEQTEGELRTTMKQTEQALRDLQKAQQSLVQAEKLASLGSLVAGIAHEINTPIGSSLTVASALMERVRKFQRELEQGTIKRSALDQFVASVDEASQIMQRSLHSAAEQIQNFKQVAVDQTSSQRRDFDLLNTVEEVLSTLRPRIKHSHHQVAVEIPEGIKMDSFPGPLGQVITNCFTNALIHGFENLDQGRILVRAEMLSPERVRLSVHDNGKGIQEDHLKRIFDPFFTTRMGQGGTGLGMNLVYTIVTGLLGGTITVDSHPGQGTEVIVDIPLVAPDDRQSSVVLDSSGDTNASE